ncbi:MAG: TolC family protein [Mariprofundaceae bacterium]|nr:TolC family protein [Mariprofundaceae bacterium]
MRIYHIILVCSGLLLLQQPAYAESITLEEAMQQAGDTHPEVRMAEQGVAAAQGMLTEKSSYAYNPEVLIEPQRRRLADRSGITNDYFITLSQGIEIPGKRSNRSKAARAGLDVAEDNAENVRQRRMIAAARAATMLDFFMQTENVRQQQKNIMQRLLKAVNQGFKAGEKNMLDVNLARASFANSLSMVAQARQRYLRAEEDMANALGLPGKRKQELHVILPSLNPGWRPPENAVQLALASRPDLQAVKANTRVGEARARLADLNRIPDPTLSLLTGRDTNDRIIGFGVNIPLPVLNAHTGAYKAAIAERERTRDMEQWSIIKLKREVTTVIREHEVAARTLTLFLQGQTPAAEDNIRLAQTAYENGEMDLSDLVIYLDRSLQARTTRFELLKRMWLAHIRVAEVLGHPEYILKGIQQ